MNKNFETKDLILKKIIDEISTLISKGALIIYPTDTVYGLGASIQNLESLDKIYQVKERNNNSPLIALLSDKKYLKNIVVINKQNKDKVDMLIKEFWPGGLTIIFEKKDIIPSNMVSNGTSIGVRIPDLETSLQVIEGCGGILATTSANISGEPTPRSYGELSDIIKSRVDIIIEYNKPLKGIESTIIDMRTTPKILREGHITKKEIEKIIGII